MQLQRTLTVSSLQLRALHEQDPFRLVLVWVLPPQSHQHIPLPLQLVQLADTVGYNYVYLLGTDECLLELV